MTTPIISCDQFADRLSDFLEREVDDAVRMRMEKHALSCEDCGALLADLRKLEIDAANLPVLRPSRDLWVGIAARIEAPVIGLNSNPRRSPRRFIPVWIGAAAAGLIGVGVMLARVIPERSSTPSTPLQAAVSPTVSAPAPSPGAAPRTQARTTVSAPAPAKTTLTANRPSPEATYDAEISRLRAIVVQRRGSLDTATIAVIERNLKVIDEAIGQCREALRKDPASQFLMESLNDALDTKVHLLRTAAMLPART